MHSSRHVYRCQFFTSKAGAMVASSCFAERIADDDEDILDAWDSENIIQVRITAHSEKEALRGAFEPALDVYEERILCGQFKLFG